eukprot:TRINITY_DN4088_c0_g1_i1.p2 TRINITY_DN4088_c0_g1~~TRINITY_DN4088_c0_g1_i1.p2  ORF type:complete len:174 (-),score=8.58 TRINITY_DN4088_c0_g1_i1:291-812(-)
MSAEHSRTVLRLYRQLLQTARCLDSEGPYKILTAERDLRVLLATRVTHSFRANKDLVDPEAIRLATMHAEETLKDAHALFNNTHTQEARRSPRWFQIIRMHDGLWGCVTMFDCACEAVVRVSQRRVLSRTITHREAVGCRGACEAVVRVSQRRVLSRTITHREFAELRAMCVW